MLSWKPALAHGDSGECLAGDLAVTSAVLFRRREHLLCLEKPQGEPILAVLCPNTSSHNAFVPRATQIERGCFAGVAWLEKLPGGGNQPTS